MIATGKALKNARIKAGITVADMAKALDVSPATVGRYQGRAMLGNAIRTKLDKAYPHIGVFSQRKQEGDAVNKLAAALDLVQKAMDRKKIDQCALAEELGKTQGYVSMMLRGRRGMSMETAAKLQRVLGKKAVKLEWLVR